MNVLILPWSLLCVLIVILLLLCVREVLIVARLSAGHPERNAAIFNAIVLLLFLLSGVYGTRMLFNHDAYFASAFTRYPNARYAPERELLDNSNAWVYVTKDAPSLVLLYYREHATASGYTVTSDDASSSNRLLLRHGTEQLFLTALTEQGETILYFSTQGELRVVAKPTTE